MSRKPKISVVIPSFQKGRYIDETLRSLATQSYGEWEGLIVDNGSVDDSVVIAKAWAARDPRFRFLDAAAGPWNGSYCRNQGLAAAVGEYVLFLDADDLLSANCLDTRLEYVQQTGERCFHVFSIETFKEIPGDDKHVWKPEKKHPLRKLLFHRLTWSVMSTLWRREFLRSIGGFDESYSRFQDIETHIRGILHSRGNFSVANKATPSAFYRCCDARMHKSSRETLVDYIESGKRFLTEAPLCLKQYGKSAETAYLSGTAMCCYNAWDEACEQAPYHERKLSRSRAKFWPLEVKNIFGCQPLHRSWFVI